MGSCFQKQEKWMQIDQNCRFPATTLHFLEVLRWAWANCSGTNRQPMCRYSEAFSFPGDPAASGKGWDYYSPWPSSLIHLPPCFSVHFSRSVVSDSLWPHGRQHARPPCPSPTPRVYSNSCPLSRWCHPAISSSVIPFSYLQSFPTSGSFLVSQFFPSGGQSVRVSAWACVLPMNIQDWFPLGLTVDLQCFCPILNIFYVFHKDDLYAAYLWLAYCKSMDFENHSYFGVISNTVRLLF